MTTPFRNAVKFTLVDGSDLFILPDAVVGVCEPNDEYYVHGRDVIQVKVQAGDHRRLFFAATHMDVRDEMREILVKLAEGTQ